MSSQGLIEGGVRQQGGHGRLQTALGYQVVWPKTRSSCSGRPQTHLKSERHGVVRSPPIQESGSGCERSWLQVSTANLERVRKVKTRHQRLYTRVVTVREELQRFLEDDDDMMKMCLTRKKELERLVSSGLGGCLCVSAPGPLQARATSASGQNNALPKEEYPPSVVLPWCL